MIKNYLVVGVVCFVIGGLAARHFIKANVQIKTETIEVVKVKENIKVIKETRPDGTTIETKETTVEKDNSTIAKTDKKNLSPKWVVSVSKDLLNDAQWSGSVGRALFDNVYVGVTYRTNDVLGVGVTVTF
jgi:hypothetical protein